MGRMKGLATARGIFARALDEARRDGYYTAVVEAEQAVYSGDLYEWLMKATAALDRDSDEMRRD